MESFDELLRQAEAAHGHLCAGQILGVRMALFGLDRLGRETGLEDPRGADRKRLITFVEIDRCATDAIAVVTGCRLGKRALKFRDWGKMAATFADLRSGRGLRVIAREDARELASKLYPHLPNRNLQQMAAYRELPDASLFGEQWVRVGVSPADLPGYRAERIICSRCGEGVNFGRFEQMMDEKLCLSCAHPELRYWESADHSQ
jgi:formylmethanofuran dehydrogenase subunit E